ncbi:VOC family protein [Aliiglaciecola sp. LCG003]|uniref:VOC family protein n=1 Tax=Aliiglaciecola sp. LCG003 TaxID=3053655 RepID=UPI00257370DF|nr:VOC family protein [Aliiglaciecola sp. LCG003]WJG10295.1 VOC family protein [Aliiglaciecola sp. LCG003]
MNLNQVTLAVDDMGKAVDFYLALGFTLIVDTAHYTRFSCPEGDSTFSLSLAEQKIKNSTVIYFEHEDLEQWVAMIQSRGIEIKQFPKMESYLWKEAIVEDPSGNKIKLYWAGQNRKSPPWKVEKYYV